jgi:hypothetical protein
MKTWLLVFVTAAEIFSMSAARAMPIEPRSLTWNIVSDREMSRLCRDHGLRANCEASPVTTYTRIIHYGRVRDNSVGAIRHRPTRRVHAPRPPRDRRALDLMLASAQHAPIAKATGMLSPVLELPRRAPVKESLNVPGSEYLFQSLDAVYR